MVTAPERLSSHKESNSRGIIEIASKKHKRDVTKLVGWGSTRRPRGT